MCHDCAMQRLRIIPKTQLVELIKVLCHSSSELAVGSQGHWKAARTVRSLSGWVGRKLSPNIPSFPSSSSAPLTWDRSLRNSSICRGGKIAGGLLLYTGSLKYFKYDFKYLLYAPCFLGLCEEEPAWRETGGPGTTLAEKDPVGI
ncbi:hypothetical protein EYF80_029375 [Liparis tanakae]|uniref:Uncharacterized protein n=1 Tax=Liparis tanakae TaxID=230148 RepID=A0A4Z2H3K2_9TELE|nr:hypothetical protein EYF80_029375 [Liparis tanakae]